MTQQEFNFKEKELLQRIPQEFREYFSACAWDEGHSAGLSEVILVLDELISNFIKPLENYNKRHGIK